jgi:predicted Zn-dependent protease
LQSASARDPEVPGIYRLMAQAYAREKDYAHADLASAQDAAEKGDIATARQLATRAKTSLPVGSPAWVRADDITNLKPPKKSSAGN